MEYVEYKKIKDFLQTSYNSGNTQPLQTFIEAIRQHRSGREGKDSNLSLWLEAFPFAMEYGTPFPTNETAGQDEVNDQLKNCRAGNNPGVIPIYLAWLWHYHPDKAETLYDMWEKPYSPYIGKPKLGNCPPKVAAAYWKPKPKKSRKRATFLWLTTAIAGAVILNLVEMQFNVVGSYFQSNTPTKSITEEQSLKIEELKVKNVNLNTDLEEVRGNFSQANGTIEELKASLELKNSITLDQKNSEEYRELEQENSRLRENVGIVVNQRDQANIELKGVRQQLTRANNNSRYWEQEHRKVSGETENLKSKIGALNGEIKQLKPVNSIDEIFWFNKGQRPKFVGTKIQDYKLSRDNSISMKNDVTSITITDINSNGSAYVKAGFMNTQIKIRAGDYLKFKGTDGSFFVLRVTKIYRFVAYSKSDSDFVEISLFEG